VEEDIELRLRAVEPAVAGWKPTAIGREVDQSREWVRRWLRRYEEEGDDGLADRPRRPKTSPSRLPQVVLDEIVTVRRLLCADRSATCGPEVIVAEIERRGLLETVPSVSSIKRVLATNNLSRRHHRRSPLPSVDPRPASGDFSWGMAAVGLGARPLPGMRDPVLVARDRRCRLPHDVVRSPSEEDPVGGGAPANGQSLATDVDSFGYGHR
jgi:transposase-like protein